MNKAAKRPPYQETSTNRTENVEVLVERPVNSTIVPASRLKQICSIS